MTSESCEYICSQCGHTVTLTGGDTVHDYKYGGSDLTTDRPDLHPVHDPQADVTMTMRCSPCRELVEVCIVRACGPRPLKDPFFAEPGAEPPLRRRYPKRRREEYPALVCPICQGTRLSLAHGCPKCGGPMRSATGPSENRQ